MSIRREILISIGVIKFKGREVTCGRLVGFKRTYRTDNGKIHFNTFFASTFGYCPLIWMFSNKIPNNALNKVQKRALSMLADKQSLSH